MLGPGLVLPDCLVIKTETYYIEGKKYSLTLFGIYGLTCIGSGRFVKHVELLDAKFNMFFIYQTTSHYDC